MYFCLRLVILVEASGCSSVKLSALLDGHIPLLGDLLDLLDLLDNDLELVIAVAELEQSLEDDALECASLVENAEDVEDTI